MDQFRDTPPAERPVAQPRPGPEPWNPYQIMGYFVILTVVGSGIGLAINWRRLGKPAWMLPTLLLSILVPAATIGSLLGWLMAFGVRAQAPFQVVGGLALLVMGVNLGFLVGLAHLQNQVYENTGNNGSPVATGPQYNLRASLLIGAGVAVGLPVVFGIFFWVMGFFSAG